MKKIINLFFLIMLSTIVFAQSSNWTSVRETNINYGIAASFDLFTNAYGNHIIVQESNALKYYKMDVNGVAMTSIPLEQNVSVVSPSITGNDNIIYVVYRKSSASEITAKVSTDGGSSWNYISQNPPNSNATSLEAIFSNERLHVAYEASGEFYIYHIYWYQGAWSPLNYVYGGTKPRLATWFDDDEDKVYIIYRINDGVGLWRVYNVESNEWSTPYLGYSVYSSPRSGPVGISVGTDRLYYYYSCKNPDSEDETLTLRFNVLDRFTGSQITPSSGILNANPTTLVYSNITNNEISHTAFWSSDYGLPGLYRVKNNGQNPAQFDQVYYHQSQNPVYNPPVNLSSAGNDVHVVWKDNLGNNNGNNLRYRYDDQAPLVPQNLNVLPYVANGVTYPKLTWSLNNEPDVRINDDAYLLERRVEEPGQGWGSWSPLEPVSGNNSQYVDYDCAGVGSEAYTAEYRMRAKDIGNHVSSYSSSVFWGFEKYYGKIISGELKRFNYQLGQNYPNPFNPATTINYSIKSAGEVTLKVYDMLGTEVASLVNENQEAGNYSVEFNASNLPSGIYFYSLASGNFVDTKKLILLK